jgi:N4-gp56 family major capsid protein
MPTGVSTLSSGTSPSDAGRYVNDRLIARSELHLRFAEMADDRPLKQGMSKTAYFIRYERTEIPMAPITEGVTPQETGLSITEKSVTPDEWGLYIALTDVVTLTTQHPVLNEAIKLIGDAIARVEESTIVDVLSGGTNVQYWDGSRANRAAITANDTFTQAVFARIVATLRDLGTPEKDGTFFHCVLGPQVEADILTQSSVGGNQTFVNFAQLNAQAAKLDPMTRGVVGAWLGLKLFRSNFIPKFVLIAGGAIPSVAASVGAGALAGTVFYKFTRKDVKRGFEEAISAEANTVMGGNNTLTFTAPAASGFVYMVYAGTVTGDSNLKLAISNISPGVAVQLLAVPAAGANPPSTPPNGFNVHPIYVFGEESLDWVPLDGMSTQGMVTPKGPSDSDPLAQRRKAGSKFMAKAGRRDDNRILRCEMASAFG